MASMERRTSVNVASRQALTLVSTAMKPRAHCISSQTLMCFESRNVRQKEKPWLENIDFREFIAPWDQLSLFPVRELRNLWFQKKQLAYSKTQDGALSQMLCTLPANFTATDCTAPRIAVHINSGQRERYCQELCHWWKWQCCYWI